MQFLMNTEDTLKFLKFDPARLDETELILGGYAGRIKRRTKQRVTWNPG